MTELQGFSKKLLFEEKTSDHQLSILLVDIMNAIGFSKSEREIHRHRVHLLNVLTTIFKASDKATARITGSTSEGMCGGIYGIQSQHGYDSLLTARYIKLYTPRTNNINSPLLLLHDNENYDASFFVEEDDNFPGYVKLSLGEVNTNYVYWFNCTRMNDDKLYFSNSMVMDFLHKQLVTSMKKFGQNLTLYQNGPAHSYHFKEYRGNSRKGDSVFCIHYDMWPNSANSFITRCKPHNWPSKSMLENIQSQGCDVVPVGHHDSTNNDIQWRISFPGEQNLLLDLTDVQALCYALIKIILRENLNTSQREVVSSFHIKHVMFWCVELCSCQWVDSNYINCLNICLAELTQMIKARHIPHYIIESRNLFNSKLTEKMSKEIVEVLRKYDTTHVFTLDTFDCVLNLTHYKNALLKRESLTSTIMACFIACVDAFSSLALDTSLFWDSHITHNATKSLLHYVNILQNLKKMKGVTIHYAKYLVRSVLGFLYYVKYKESKKTDCLLASKRLIQKSLNMDNCCVKLRAATFFLTTMEYSESVEICNTFLTIPPTYRLFGSYSEYVNDIVQEVFQLFKVKTTEEIENIMTKILPMFYTSVKLKSLPENYDITQQHPIWIFRNFTNIFFHGLYMEVPFMMAEKWVVPDPILYEMLSLSADAELSLSCIRLDPMFVCLHTKFLCYHSMGNVNGMAEMLTLMNSYFTDSTFTTKRCCVYLNMLAYCQIKAGHHRQSVKSILQSLRIFPSRYNTASGYLKIVLQILNSLFI